MSTKNSDRDDDQQQQQNQEQQDMRSTDEDVARLRRHMRALRDALLRFQRHLLSQPDDGSENGHGGGGDNGSSG